jgi:hypothetical protein
LQLVSTKARPVRKLLADAEEKILGIRDDDDEVQIPAHNLVLASCSTFFMSILRTNVHSHPLLYLSGLNSRSLGGYILDYMYHGEVKIVQRHLDSFLDSAQKLKTKGDFL